MLADSLLDEMRILTERTKNIEQAMKLCLGREFSNSVQISPYGGSLWITVNNREDLMAALSISNGEQWRKDSSDAAITYHWDNVGYPVSIYAQNDAIPPTCKVIEVDEVIPAQPERIVKRKKIQCNEPAEEPTQDAPVLEIPADESGCEKEIL